MKISYKKLWVMLAEKEISKVELRKTLKLAPGTMTKLNQNEEVSMSILMRICGHLGCDIGDILLKHLKMLDMIHMSNCMAMC